MPARDLHVDRPERRADLVEEAGPVERQDDEAIEPAGQGRQVFRVEGRLVEQGRDARARGRHDGDDDALDRPAVEAPSVIDPLQAIQPQRDGLAGQGGRQRGHVEERQADRFEAGRVVPFLQRGAGRMIDGAGLAAVDRGEHGVDARGRDQADHQVLALRPPGQGRTGANR